MPTTPPPRRRPPWSVLSPRPPDGRRLCVESEPGTAVSQVERCLSRLVLAWRGFPHAARRSPHLGDLAQLSPTQRARRQAGAPGRPPPPAPGAPPRGPSTPPRALTASHTPAPRRVLRPPPKTCEVSALGRTGSPSALRRLGRRASTRPRAPGRGPWRGNAPRGGGEGAARRALWQSGTAEHVCSRPARASAGRLPAPRARP